MRQISPDQSERLYSALLASRSITCSDTRLVRECSFVLHSSCNESAAASRVFHASTSHSVTIFGHFVLSSLLRVRLFMSLWSVRSFKSYALSFCFGHVLATFVLFGISSWIAIPRRLRVSLACMPTIDPDYLKWTKSSWKACQSSPSLRPVSSGGISTRSANDLCFYRRFSRLAPLTVTKSISTYITTLRNTRFSHVSPTFSDGQKECFLSKNPRGKEEALDTLVATYEASQAGLASGSRLLANTTVVLSTALAGSHTRHEAGNKRSAMLASGPEEPGTMTAAHAKEVFRVS